MYCKCDGCGKEAPAESYPSGWCKPSLWFQRTPEGETTPLIACSRACIDAVEAKRKAEGKASTTVVLPI